MTITTTMFDEIKALQKERGEYEDRLEKLDDVISSKRDTIKSALPFFQKAEEIKSLSHFHSDIANKWAIVTKGMGKENDSSKNSFAVDVWGRDRYIVVSPLGIGIRYNSNGRACYSNLSFPEIFTIFKIENQRHIRRLIRKSYLGVFDKLMSDISALSLNFDKLIHVSNAYEDIKGIKHNGVEVEISSSGYVTVNGDSMTVFNLIKSGLDVNDVAIAFEYAFDKYQQHQKGFIELVAVLDKYSVSKKVVGAL